jgi:hypothetical protein
MKDSHKMPVKTSTLTGKTGQTVNQADKSKNGNPTKLTDDALKGVVGGVARNVSRPDKV